MEILPSQDSMPDTPTAGERPALLRTTFLSTGPEAFGLISDAMPLATRHLLLAAGGDRVAGDGGLPLYGCESGEPEEVAQTLFPMLDIHPILLDILRMNLGDCKKPQEQPLSRYCAMLVTAAVYEALSKSPKAFPVASSGSEGEKPVKVSRDDSHGETEETSVQESSGALAGNPVGESSEKPGRLNDFDLTLARLSLTLPSLLDEFRHSLYDRQENHTSMPVVSEEYFNVSFGACRVSPGETVGDWVVDVFMAGDFRVFLLDAHGLASLWNVQTRPLSILDSPDVTGHRLYIRHNEPFAILLLSGGLCDAGYIDIHARRDTSARTWRARMRLEEQLLRVIVSCEDEEEFGIRAARAVAGRAVGQNCISGAMTVLSTSGGDFEAFRLSCQSRLDALEELLALLPEEYDPARITPQLPCGESERAYVSDLFARRPKLRQSTISMLETCIRDRLNQALTHVLSKGPGAGRSRQEGADNQGTDTATLRPMEAQSSPKEDIPVRMLSEEFVYDTFRQYDKDNDQDREQINKNRRIIRQVLSSHWVTLRSVLARLCMPSETKTLVEADEDRGRRMYDSCLEMNQSLNSMLEDRRRKLSAVEALLSDSLEVLRSASDDWAMGRGSEVSFADWMHGLSEELPGILRPIQDSWRDATQRYRSLQTAYTAERETLFDYDTATDRGFWHPVFRSIMEGKLPDTTWADIRREAATADKEGAYGNMFDALRIISEQILTLTQRIQSRAAEHRCVQALCVEFEWQFACLRASVYGDISWHSDIESLLDDGTRNEFKAVVRRWQETEALQKRQKEAFRAYQDMYNTFLK